MLSRAGRVVTGPYLLVTLFSSTKDCIAAPIVFDLDISLREKLHSVIAPTTHAGSAEMMIFPAIHL